MEKLAEGFKGQKAIVTPYNVRQLQAKNHITKHMYITHIGYYPHAKYHFFQRDQGANENIFIYCSEGNGWIMYRNERFTLSRNQAFIIPEKEPHSYGAGIQNPWSIYWFHFRGENVKVFSSIIGRIINIDDSYKSRLGDRLQLFEEIYQNLEMGYNHENLEYISYCLLYFLASLKYMSQYSEIKNVKESDVIQKSILFMKNNLEIKITLEDIAQHVGYSSSYFGTLFSERTSYSVMEYYNQLKIQRACSYLQFSDLKIKEIAFRLGYYDPFHFSRSFNNEMEITPSEYRKRYKKDKTPDPSASVATRI